MRARWCRWSGRSRRVTTRHHRTIWSTAASRSTIRSRPWRFGGRLHGVYSGAKAEGSEGGPACGEAQRQRRGGGVAGADGEGGGDLQGTSFDGRMRQCVITRSRVVMFFGTWPDEGQGDRVVACPGSQSASGGEAARRWQTRCKKEEIAVRNRPKRSILRAWRAILENQAAAMTDQPEFELAKSGSKSHGRSDQKAYQETFPSQALRFRLLRLQPFPSA